MVHMLVSRWRGGGGRTWGGGGEHGVGGCSRLVWCSVKMGIWMGHWTGSVEYTSNTTLVFSLILLRRTERGSKQRWVTLLVLLCRSLQTYLKAHLCTISTFLYCLMYMDSKPRRHIPNESDKKNYGQPIYSVTL